MSDKPKDQTPILIIVICAGFTMIVSTIASAIKIMGYDEVIQADAKARAAVILQGVNSNQACKIDESIINQVNENTLSIELLAENSHKAGG